MEFFVDWIYGNLTEAARVWSALAPAILLSAYFVVGLLLYGIRVLLRGPYRVAELQADTHRLFPSTWLRPYFAWVTHPLWWLVHRAGIPSTAVATLEILLALSAGIALAAGRFALGGWLCIFSGVVDLIDTRLASSRPELSPARATLQATFDRYSDAAVLIGLAWFYRGTWVLIPVLVAMVGFAVIPLLRAQGQAAGLSVRSSLITRTERIVYLGVGCAMSPLLEVAVVPDDPRPLHRLAVIGIVMTAAATQLTAVQRLLHIMEGLGSGTAGRWVRANRGVFVRNTVSAVVATVLDFFVVTALVTAGLASPVIATGVGSVFGGVINYSMNRWWTFKSGGSKLPEASRYAFVSASSAVLNSGGVGVLLLLPLVDYRIAWWFVRLAIYLAWNYPLQRSYVFGPTGRGGQTLEEPAPSTVTDRR